MKIKKKFIKKLITTFLITTMGVSNILPTVATISKAYESSSETILKENTPEVIESTEEAVNMGIDDFIVDNNIITAITDNAKEKIKGKEIIIKNLGKELDIGPNVFSETEITGVTIGSEIKNIGEHAFQKNKLRKVIIEGDLVNIGEYAFADNIIQTYKENANIENIEKHAFSSNNLVTFISSAKKIGDSVFSSNKLQEVTFTRVEKIEDNAFIGNPNIKKITIDTKNPIQEIFTDKILDDQSEPVDIFINKNGNNIVSTDKSKYLINPVKVVVLLKEKSSNSILENKEIEKYELKDLPEKYVAPHIKNYRINGENEKVIDKESIVDNMINLEFFYDKLNSPQIIIENAKQFTYNKNTRLNIKDILKDIIFYDSNGQKIDPVFTIGDILDTRITLSKNSIDDSNDDENKTVKITLTDGELSTSIDLTFRFENFDKGNEEIISGKDWIYNDFQYNNGILNGFSELGIEKLKTNKDIILPDVNPKNGMPITRIDGSAFHKKDIKAVDFEKMIHLEEIGGASFKETGVVFVKGLEKLNKLKVIDWQSFQGNKLKEFDFSLLTSLEKIGSDAFRDNLLEEVNLAGHQKLKNIDSAAFYNNKIRKVSLNDIPLLAELGNYLFEKNLIKGELSISNLPKLNRIPHSMFKDNFITDLELKNLPELIEIRDYSFRNNKIENVVFSGLPKLVKFEGDDSFAANKIKRLDFSELTSLERLSGFKNNEIEYINFSGLENLKEIGGNYGFLGNKLKEVNLSGLPNLEKIGHSAFKENPDLTKVILKDLPKLVSINEDVFSNTSIENVEIVGLPKLKIIKGFNSNSKLKKVILKDLPNVISIGGFGSSKIDNLVIKNLPKLESFEHTSFHSNSGLTKFVLEEVPNLSIIGSYSFSNNKISGELNLMPYINLTEIDNNAYSSNEITALKLEGLNKLVKIKNSSFSSNKIEKVEIKDLEKLEIIENRAFFHQNSGKSLKTVEIKNIPNLRILSGFEHNYSLNEIKLDGLPNLEEIGSEAFRDSVTADVDLSNLPKLKKIGEKAYFKEASERRTIRTLKLPDTIENIGEKAFYGNLLSNIDLSTKINLKSIGSNAFSNNFPILESFRFPNTTEPIEIGKHIATLGDRDLDFTNQPNVKLKLMSAKPFLQKEPLILKFKKASQLTLDSAIKDLDPDNPTIIYIDEMDKEIDAPKGILINPKKVTVKYEKNTGETVINPEIKYIGEDTVFNAKTINGLGVVNITSNLDNEVEKNITSRRATIKKSDSTSKEQELKFIYETIQSIPDSNYKISIKRTVFTDREFYHRDKALVLEALFDLSAIPNDEDNVKLVIQLPEYATDDPKLISFPADIPYGNGSLELVEPAYYDTNTKQIIYHIKKIPGNSAKISIRTQFQFDGLDTPLNSVTKANAFYVLKDGKIKGNIAESEEFVTKYHNPDASKENNFGVESNIRVPWEDGSNDKWASVTIPYRFSFNNLQRRAKEFIIKDTLPTYKRYGENGNIETVRAIFDQNKNQGWVYDSNTNTATYRVNKETLDLLTESNDNSYIHPHYISSKLPKLVLDFPKAVSQTDIVNNAEMEIIIDNPKFDDKEKIKFNKSIKNSISIDFKSNGIGFYKNGKINGIELDDYEYLPPFSDNRQKDYIWGIRFNPSHVIAENREGFKNYIPKLKNIEIWDYSLDYNVNDSDKLLNYSFVISDRNAEVYLYDKVIPWSHDVAKINMPNENLVSPVKKIKAGQRLILNEDEQAKTKSIRFVFKDYEISNLDESIDIKVGTRLKPGKIIPFIDREINNLSKAFLDISVDELGIKDRPLALISNSYKYIRKNKKYIETTKTSNIVSNSPVLNRDQKIEYKLGFKAGYSRMNITNKFNIKDFELIDLFPKYLDLNSIELNPKFEEVGGTYKTELDDKGGKIIFSAPYVPSDLGWVAKIKSGIKSSTPGDAEINNKAYIKFTQESTNPDEQIEIRSSENIAEENNNSFSTANSRFNVLFNDSFSISKYIRNSSRNGLWMSDVKTKPGELIEYKLEVTNNIPIDTNRIEILDLFSNINDRFLVDNLLGINPLRGSEFGNNLLSIKSIRLIDNKTNVSKDAKDSFPVTYLLKNDEYPRSILEGDAITWTERVLKDESLKTDDPTKAKGIYLGGIENSIIPKNNTLEIVLEFKAPIFDMKNHSEWEGKKAVNTFAVREIGDLKYSESSPVSNTMEAPKRNLKFRKVEKNNQNNTLEGARFRLVQGNKIKEAVSGPDGILYFNDVYYEPYTLTEIVAPSGYKLDNETKLKQLSLNDYISDLEKLKNRESINDIVDTFENELLPIPEPNKTYSIKVHKKNKDRNLKNVKIKLENLQTKQIYEDITNNEGLVNFDNLTSGQFKLEEISNNDRFSLIEPVVFELPLKDDFSSPSIENIIKETDVNDSDHTKYTFEIQNKLFSIDMIKIGVNDLIRTKQDHQRKLNEGERLRDVEFHLYDTGKIFGQEHTGNEIEKEIDILITDKNGKVKINKLAPNRIYKLVEKNTPTNYLKKEPVEFFVDESGNVKTSEGEPYLYDDILLVSNIRSMKKSRAIVTKIDTLNQNKLEGAEFKILKEKNGVYEELIGDEYSKKTGESGMISFDNLEYGNYKILETKSPVGYLRGIEPILFTVDPYNSRIFNKTVKNKKMNLNIVKVEKISGPYENDDVAKQELKKLASREDFSELFVAENNIYKKLKGAEIKLIENFSDNEGPRNNVIVPVSDQENGYSHYKYSDGLVESGSYIVEEVNAPEGYIKSKPQNIKLDRLLSFNNSEFTFYLKNKKKKGEIIISKFQGRNKKVISGAEFTIYKGNLTRDELSDDKIITKGETNSEGLVKFNELELGEYTIAETKAPDNFKIIPKVIHANLTSDNPVFRQSIYNNFNTTTISIKKVDDKGNPIVDLSNSKFDLYYDGKLYSTGVASTDINETGIIKFTDVPIIGNYKIKETVAPEGYTILDNGEINFSADKNNPLAVNPDNNEIREIKNKELTNIVAKKIWINGIELNRPDAFLKLYRKVDGGQEEAVDVEIKHVGQVNFTVDFGKFDKYLHKNNGEVLEYSYFVKVVNKDSDEINISNYNYKTTIADNGLTIINKYESPKINLKVLKQWVNGKNATKPDLKFSVYRKTQNSSLEKVDSLEQKVPKDGLLDKILNKDNETVFKDLPVTDEQENVYTYVVKEEKEDGNKLDDSIYFKHDEEEVEAVKLDGNNYLSASFVNKYKSPIKNIVATKKWINGPNDKPDVWFKLYRKTGSNNGTPIEVDATKVVDKATNEVSWENLDETDINGNKYIYFVKEVNESGTNEDFVPKNYKKEEKNLQVTNTYISPKINRTVKKVWKSIDGETKPSQIKVVLKRFLGENKIPDPNFVEEKILNENNGWKYTFTNLDKTDVNGEEYSYKVEEERHNGYDTSIELDDAKENYIITNKQKVIEKSVRKVWENSSDDSNPASVKVKLMRNNRVYKTAVLNAENEWSYSFKNLPQYDENGNEYTYNFDEVDIKGYDKFIDNVQGTITNTRKIINIQVDKIWKDESDNADKPKNITVNLYRNRGNNTNPYKTMVLTKGNNENTWTGTFENLPEYDLNGNKYTYEIDEVDIKGYNKSVKDNVITNTRMLTEIAVKKNWENTENTYPNDITYRLYRDGVEIASKTVVGPNWDYTFTNDSNNNKLAKVNPLTGEDYNYTVTEDKVIGYSSKINKDNKFNFINTQETKKIILEKKWINGSKPMSIITLKRRVKAVDSKNLPEEEDTSFRKDFEATVTNPRSQEYNVPTHRSDGREYEYYVVEENVPENYNSLIRDFTVTNTYVIPHMSVSAEKVWINGSKIKSDVYFKLYRKTSKSDVEEVPNARLISVKRNTEHKEEHIKVKWDNIESTNRDGEPYKFSIKEVDKSGNEIKNELTSKGIYSEISKDRLKITNTYISPKVSKTLLKKWDIVEGEKLPDNIKVKLYRYTHNPNQEEPNFEKVLILNKINGWSGIYTDLEKTDEDGVPYTYIVKEVKNNAYISSVSENLFNNDFVLENTQKIIDKNIRIKWENSTKDPNPTSVTVNILRNGKIYKSAVITDSDWSKVFNKLPRFDENGKEYKYTISENNVPGYDTVIDQENGIVTNTRRTIAVEVTKIWDDKSNNLDRPNSIVVNLFRNDEKISYESIKLAKGNDENIWNYIFKNLPETDLKGNKYVYRVDEEDIAGYKKVIEKYSITNIRELKTIPITKIWENTEKVYPEKITYRLFRGNDNNEEPIEIAKHEATKDKWNHVFTEDSNGNKLPTINPKNGKPYIYSIKEDKVIGYTTKIDGFNIINTQDTKKIVVKKIWKNGPMPNAVLVLRRGINLDKDSQTGKYIINDKVDKNFNKEFTATKEYPSKEYVVPIYNTTGQKYTYFVEEKNIPENYISSISNFEVTNTYVIPKTQISAKKIWVNSPSSKKPKIWFKLYRKIDKLNIDEEVKDSIKVIEPNKEDKVEVKWDNIEKTDLRGENYTFYVKEVNEKGVDFKPDGYDKKEDGLTIINTYLNNNTKHEKSSQSDEKKDDKNYKDIKESINKSNTSNSLLPQTGSEDKYLTIIAILLFLSSIAILTTRRKYE